MPVVLGGSCEFPIYLSYSAEIRYSNLLPLLVSTTNKISGLLSDEKK